MVICKNDPPGKSLAPTSETTLDNGTKHSDSFISATTPMILAENSLSRIKPCPKPYVLLHIWQTFWPT